MPVDCLPMPAWAPRPGRPPLLQQIAKAATNAWARAALYFLDESASALSKRLSSKQAREGTNSKYLYQFINGKREVYPQPNGKYRHNWFAAIHRYRAGNCATCFYYQPWELMVETVSLDRVDQLLYQALERSFGGEGIDSFFYVQVIPGLPEGEAWRRKFLTFESEFSVLWEEAERWVGDDDDREWQVFDRFTVVWCLYREAMLRRDVVRAIYYREKIVQSHAEIARHPVFSQVFKEYKRCAKCVLGADGLPARKELNLKAVKLLVTNDPTLSAIWPGRCVQNFNSFAYRLLTHPRSASTRRRISFRIPKLGKGTHLSSCI